MPLWLSSRMFFSPLGPIYISYYLCKSCFHLCGQFFLLVDILHPAVDTVCAFSCFAAFCEPSEIISLTFCSSHTQRAESFFFIIILEKSFGNKALTQIFEIPLLT